MEKLLKSITKNIEDAFVECGYDRRFGFVSISNRPDLCQFQCNGALGAAKVYKKRPAEIAQEVICKLEAANDLCGISFASPGFINITLKDRVFIEYVNKMKGDSRLGVDFCEIPRKIIIDFGGANVAKPLHVGHMRTAIIGEALKRIGRYLGHEVIGDVHLGDWGKPMGLVITEIKRRNPNLPYFQDTAVTEYPIEAPFTISELEDIYPAASKRAKEDEGFMEEAKRATFLLQSGKEGHVALWRHILRVSTEDLKKNYGNLNVEFDLWKGESDAHKYIDTIIAYLKENKYAYESQGALVVDVAELGDMRPMPPFMLLKSDGAVLYDTTDLASIYERVKDFDPDAIMYVVDNRQELHFEQVFRCAKKAKIASEAVQLEFIGYGTMNGKDGKPFKTRDGGVMRLESLISEVKDKVKEKLTKGNNNFQEKEIEDISRMVGLAALKYGDLSNHMNKDYIFDIDKFTSFEGKTGPYILYSIVRIKSILRKASHIGNESSPDIKYPRSSTEREIIIKLCQFNEVIESCFNERLLHRVCEYMFELSNLFNKFYQENRILTEENWEVKESWINLLKLIESVLGKCCELLAVDVPEKM